MINSFAGPIYFTPGEMLLLILQMALMYFIVYAPFVIIPIGIILTVRLFFIKNRTKRATIIALSFLGYGLAHTLITYLMYHVW